MVPFFPLSTHTHIQTLTHMHIGIKDVGHSIAEIYSEETSMLQSQERTPGNIKVKCLASQRPWTIEKN